MTSYNRRNFIKKTALGAAAILTWPLHSKAFDESSGRDAHYDVIVLGLGVMGLSSCYHIARLKKGARVLGIEQFDKIPHVHGESHGDSRVYRKAYFEGEVYVPLMKRSYELWKSLESDSGEAIMHECGVLIWGKRKDAKEQPGIIQEVQTVSQHQNVPTTMYDGVNAEKKWPMYRRPTTELLRNAGVKADLANGNYDAIFEPEAGFLDVNAALKAFLSVARKAGAELHLGEKVEAFQVSESGVVVKTNRATYSADQLVVAGGPWTKDLLTGHLNLPLSLSPKVQLWFEASDAHTVHGKDVPIFAYDLPAPYGFMYGFPKLTDERGIKVACHIEGYDGASMISSPSQIKPGSKLYAESIHRSTQNAEKFLSTFFPNVKGKHPYREEPCNYTMAPDSHWIIDKDPTHSRLNIGCGFSGHGFKCAPAIGEVLAGMALGLKPHADYDLSFFKVEKARQRLAAKKNS